MRFSGIVRERLEARSLRGKACGSNVGRHRIARLQTYLMILVVGVGDLDDHFDLDRYPERQLGHADR